MGSIVPVCLGKCEVNGGVASVKRKSFLLIIIMGFFGLFFLLLFIGFVVYFFGGILLLKSRGASGIEMIPHYTFWVSLPSKTKAGFTYLLHGCKHSDDSYEEI